MDMRHALVDTPLGEITIVATDDAITGLYFRHHVRRPPRDALGRAAAITDDEVLADAAGQLFGYLAGRRHEFDLPLHAAGDPFQHAVWSIVAEIPFGETITYGQIAERLGYLAYEVGQAVGANPLCIFVPCHRVVGANGNLTGYAGGLKRKRALLQLEEPAQVRLF
jgi:methylated-DNA-[protein]-cysteine S-methyltransferase